MTKKFPFYKQLDITEDLRLIERIFYQFRSVFKE